MVQIFVKNAMHIIVFYL